MAALIPVNALGDNAWPLPVFISAKNFRRISLKSIGLTVLRSTVIFPFSHHFSNFFTPHSVALLVFFAWAFCPISSSCSLSKSEFWLEKSWKFGTSKSPAKHHAFTTKLQSEQVQTHSPNLSTVTRREILTYWLPCRPSPPMTSLGLYSNSDVIAFDQNGHHVCSTSAGGKDLSNDS